MQTFHRSGQNQSPESAHSEAEVPTRPFVLGLLTAGLPESVRRVIAVPDLKCRLCGCRLGIERGDDRQVQVCGSCKDRPEYARLVSSPGSHRSLGVASLGQDLAARPSRDFTVAELSLIGKVAGYMPAQQLLQILNERLFADLGPDVQPYSMEQLHEQITAAGAAAAPKGGHDWSSLRKILARARRSGLLAQIDDQMISDFAVVFSLNAKQVLHLKDIVRSQYAEGEGSAS